MTWSRFCSAAVGPILAFMIVSPAVAGEVIQIKINDLVFSPAHVSARIGDTVEWVNGDFVAHTATAGNGDWDVSIAPHGTRRLVIKRAGTVDYYCRYHPAMTGQVQVAE